MADDRTTYQKAQLQVVAHRNIQSVVGEVLSPRNLNTSQWVVLGWLHENPQGMRVTSLAEVLQVETPLITALTQPLTAAGLLQTKVDPVDKRARRLTLTSEGEKVVEETEATLSNRLKMLQKGIKKTSLNCYFSALEQYIDNYRKLPRQ